MAALREIGDRLDGKPAPAMPPEAEDAPTKIIYTWSDPLDTLPASPPPAIGG
jgi:hypothetical protein